MTKKKIARKNETAPQLYELSDGASKAFENAKELFQEASLLRAHGALSRALFLYQISLEECAKVDMIGAWAASTLMGSDVDANKASASLASHKAKNYTNAYMLPARGKEIDARASADWHQAIEAFKDHQAKFHLDSNSAKNASLYVNFEDGVFSCPRDRITEAMVDDIAGRNAEFLDLVGPKVTMLARWCSDPESVKEMLSWFASRAEQLRSELPRDPGQAISMLMQEMMEQAKGSRYYSVATGKKTSSGDDPAPAKG